MNFEIPDPSTLKDLEAVAHRVAIACGRLIVDERPAHLEVAATKSSATDVVTIMDHRSEQLAMGLLQELRPDDGVLGEEGVDISGSTGVTWIIDPIDGTVNYLYGIPWFGVSVAAVVGDAGVEGGWRPVAGAVYNPITDELCSAYLSGGARLRGAGKVRDLRFDAPPDLASSLVVTGFSYSSGKRAWQGQIASELLPQIRDLRRMGSASIDICSLALGRADLYYESGINSWDMAAAWLIITEAGATMRGFDTPYPTKRMAIAGRADLAERIVEIIAPRWDELPRDS